MINPSDFKILVVEDEVDALNLYLDILKASGFVVEGALNGDEAMTKLSTMQFNLILLDIIMPNRDGIQVLTDIKAQPDKYGNPKVVMLSNIGGDIAIDKAMQLGANGYMLKSEVEPTEMVNVVTKYLE